MQRLCVRILTLLIMIAMIALLLYVAGLRVPTVPDPFSATNERKDWVEVAPPNAGNHEDLWGPHQDPGRTMTAIKGILILLIDAHREKRATHFSLVYPCAQEAQGDLDRTSRRTLRGLAMSTNNFDSSSLPDALGPILESFLARLRRGEHPSIKEYADRHPDLAAQILEVFPPLAEMELAGMSADASLQPAASATDAPGATGDRGTRSRPADAAGDPPFERLGDYRIIREIGGGGMGIVYEAEREALRSRVALKVMHPKLRNRPDHLRWFLREAQAAAGLHHTNIVTVFDYGQHDGVCYYAMQYIAGHSLDKVLEDVKRLKREAKASSEASGKVERAPHPEAAVHRRDRAECVRAPTPSYDRCPSGL